MRTLLSAGVLLALAGCGQSVSVEKTVDLSPGLNLAPIVIDGPKREQKIKVEFTASDGILDAYVILGKDEEAILNELDRVKPKLDILASKTKSSGDTLEATIPAGQDYGVYLANASKKMKVTVKLKSQ
jgi:hypothetical protein